MSAAAHPCRPERPPLWVLAALLGLAACAADEPAPAPPETPTASIQNQAPLSPACVDGALEPCTVMLGEHGGIVSCYEGVRSCAGGSLGACSDGYAFEVERPDPALAADPGLRPLAYSQAVDCTNNPCNRYCREFNEAPPQSLGPNLDADAPPLSSWVTGNASDYPPEQQVLGNREPCQVASDCQLNTFCGDPSLGSCSHSVCSEGEPLADGCNRCADAVCAENPFCCGPQQACAHDPCEVGTGAPLNRRCDTCVNAVCEAHPECCEEVWDEACVGYVASECAPLGQSCGCTGDGLESATGCIALGADKLDWASAYPTCIEKYGPAWSLLAVTDEAENEIARRAVEGAGVDGAWLDGFAIDVDQWSWRTLGEPFFSNDASGGTAAPGAYVNWGPGEPELGVAFLGVTLGPDGFWSDAALDAQHGYLCEGPKDHLTPRQPPLLAWDSECAALAPEVCGVSCADGLGTGAGACTARVPTDLEASCAGFDLSLGATCEAESQPQIPVCNHGQVAAPAGLRLVHLPIEQFGRAEPDLSEAVDCALTEPIPAGRCVALSDCPGLAADRALLVNPPGATQDTSECRLDDNWSIYQPLGCGPAVCESSVLDAARVRRAGCTIELEHPLGVDTARASVTVRNDVPEPTGTVVLSPVASLADCTGDDQFYFTGNDTAPAQLHLCPLACDAGAGDEARRLLDVEIACLPPGQPALLTERSVLYGEDGATSPAACPGSTPQWDFLYYDAVTPADSRVELLVRTAMSAEDLAAGVTTPISVANARALPTDTQRCDGVGQGCPIDLYGALGDAGQLQQMPLLELIVRLVPGSNGEAPVLRDWTVRFSCPPSQ